MDILALDGGASTEINTRGFDIHGDPLWSARLLMTNPEVIKDVHKSFLESGCDMIQTISYQASVPGICKYSDKSAEEAQAVMEKSVHLARSSVEEFWADYKKKAEMSDSTLLADRKKPLVCGCLGPYGVNLFNASEYSGKYITDVSEQEILDFQKPRIETLVSAGIDFLAMETIPVQKEAEIILKLLREIPNVPKWISFQCKDGIHTGHGEKFSDAIQSVTQDGYIKYVGANCCSPAVVTPLLESVQPLRSERSLQFVVYPNSGEVWEKATFEEKGRFVGDNLISGFASEVPKWIDLGSTIIGGCCQTTPQDTRLMVHKINEIRKGAK